MKMTTYTAGEVVTVTNITWHPTSQTLILKSPSRYLIKKYGYEVAFLKKNKSLR